MHINRKEFRNKFNGKLVMTWAEVGPGPIVADIIEGFYVHVYREYSLSFPEFMAFRTPREVRLEFFRYYDPLGEVFGDRLPY